MVSCVEQMVVGLHRDEIISLLGEPNVMSDGIFYQSGRGLSYIIRPNVGLLGFNHDLLIIILDENLIATGTKFWYG